jgi:hypothetical protein
LELPVLAFAGHRGNRRFEAGFLPLGLGLGQGLGGLRRGG